MSRKPVERKQVNVRLETELYDFLAEYARSRYKSVTALIREMVVGLRQEAEREREETNPPPKS